MLVQVSRQRQFSWLWLVISVVKWWIMFGLEMFCFCVVIDMCRCCLISQVIRLVFEVFSVCVWQKLCVFIVLSLEWLLLWFLVMLWNRFVSSSSFGLCRCGYILWVIEKCLLVWLLVNSLMFCSIIRVCWFIVQIWNRLNCMCLDIWVNVGIYWLSMFRWVICVSVLIVCGLCSSVMNCLCVVVFVLVYVGSVVSDLVSVCVVSECRLCMLGLQVQLENNVKICLILFCGYCGLLVVRQL